MVEWVRFGIAVECHSFLRKALPFVTFGDIVPETGGRRLDVAEVTPEGGCPPSAAVQVTSPERRRGVQHRETTRKSVHLGAVQMVHPFDKLRAGGFARIGAAMGENPHGRSSIQPLGAVERSSSMTNFEKIRAMTTTSAPIYGGTTYADPSAGRG